MIDLLRASLQFQSVWGTIVILKITVNKQYIYEIFEIWYVFWYVLDWYTGRRQRTPEAVFSFKEGNVMG